MTAMFDGFETERLVVRELSADDLEVLLGVYASNPDYLELTEGSGGEPGRYDLEMLQRDVAVARMAGRQLGGICLRQSGELIGVVDWMRENPLDGKAWVGLLMIRADLQRQGLASEAFAGLAVRLRASGATEVRASVVARDSASRAFAQRLGFEPVALKAKRMASEEESLVLEVIL